MNKRLLTLFLILLTCSLYGQTVKTLSGSLDFLKTVKEINVSFSYNNMKVGKLTEQEFCRKKMDELNERRMGLGDEWMEAWSNNKVQKYEPKFIEALSNGLSARGILVWTAKNASASKRDALYTIVINTDFIEPGFNVGVVRKNASIDIICRFIDKSTKKEIAVVSISGSSSGASGADDFEMAFRIQESYIVAGRELLKCMTSCL